jgi:hypothetical protein
VLPCRHSDHCQCYPTVGPCCHTVAAHASAGHHHARARRRDRTVRRLRTVYGDTMRHLGNRRAYRGVSLPAPCVSGRPYFLTWARSAHQSAFNAVVGQKTREGPSTTGTWQGQPCTHRRGGTWRHRTPGLGPRDWPGRSGPWRSSLHTWRPRTSLGSPGPWGPSESLPAFMGTWRPRSYKSTE